MLACLTPMYDVERFGCINTGDPKQANIFAITGSVNHQNVEIIKRLYDQMPEPKVVVSVGICAYSGGVFYGVLQRERRGVETVIPVDVYVPGCAAHPESIIDGVVQALGILEQKYSDSRAGGKKRKAVPLLQTVIRRKAGDFLPQAL